MGWFRKKHDGGVGDGPTLTFEERLGQISPGVPGRCPTCDGVGYIDSIDLGQRYQIQHCTECRHRWEYLFDADGAVADVVLDLRDAGSADGPVRDRAEQVSSAGRTRLPADG